MSSIQDALLGLKERNSGNLNWAATCSYYSLVHGGRLLSFLALGDYPTSHAILRNLMAGSPDKRKGPPFDWLHGFSKGAADNNPAPDRKLADVRSWIIQYLHQIGLEDAERQVDRFGSLLRAAGPLRNDSNYEALLIAHEYNHVRVSSAFRQLADHMGRAAEVAVKLGVTALRRFVEYDPDLDTRRMAYCHFLNDYVDQRLIPAVRNKLDGIAELSAKLVEFTSELRVPPTAGAPLAARWPELTDYADLEETASIDIFVGKENVMDHFDEGIEDLSRVIRGEIA